MTPIGALRITPRSQMARALALTIALMLAFACLADVALGVGDEPDGCPQVKLEGQRLPASFVVAAVIPGRVELGEPPLLARVVHGDNSSTPPSVFSSRATPRAPPAA
jgi:hypothetical protein